MIYVCQYNIDKVPSACNVYCEIMGFCGEYTSYQSLKKSTGHESYNNPQEIGDPRTFPRFLTKKFIDVPVELNEGDMIDGISIPWYSSLITTIAGANLTVLKIDDGELTYIQSDGKIVEMRLWNLVIFQLQRKMRLLNIDELIKMCE